MAEADYDIDTYWTSVLAHLATDNRITPQLRGFLDLVKPRGVLAHILYLEVPNELTRGMLEQRVRIPLMSAMETIEDNDIQNFALVVNPDIETSINPTPNPLGPSEPDGDLIAIDPTPTQPISSAPYARLNEKYTFDSF
ncbi:MAG: chromosomal replication initiator protein DnaA, partial [Pontimonas sp.]